jgi:hypothetical protein
VPIPPRVSIVIEPNEDRLDDDQQSLWARRWHMPAEAVPGWLAAEPAGWIRAHAALLHHAGLSPEQAQTLHEALPEQVRPLTGRLLSAGQMACLDLRHASLWAAAGLLRPQAAAGQTGASCTAWVTQARQYIAAAGGDEHLAALAAAAGLSVAEAAQARQAGDLTVPALRTLHALRSPAPGLTGDV